MYLAIIVLPLLGSIVSGFFGRKVGVRGAQFITSSCIAITTFIAILIFYETGLNSVSVSVLTFRWVDSESLNVLWGFNFDSLTVSMLIPVLIVSLLVHIYSIGYMSHDPHNQRFFSYLSLFTFMMVILITANNFLLMFVGWEGVGVCSYLLVSFWFTRIAANQSSISAFLTNRVGDCFLTLGMFVILLVFGNLDYTTVFSLAPFVSENIITIIGICLLIGAMAKSSQIGLHVWLPLAMEGPTPVSALIHAATMVTAGVYLLMRASPIIEYSSTVLILCLWIGGITTIFSSLIGLFQQDIKKVIAYSTMSQLGMMVIAVGLSAYNIALFHLINHAFYKGLLFLGAGAVIHAIADNQDFRRYGGVLIFLPLTYTVMLIASLSLMAFPFMTGFYSKDFILESAYGQYKYSGIAIYFIATMGAIFTTLYSVKVLYITFLSKANGPLINYKNIHESDIYMSLPTVILALFSIFFGYISKDIFIGLASGFFMDNSLFTHPLHEITLAAEFAVPLFFKLLPLIFTILFSVCFFILLEFLPLFIIYIKYTRLGYNLFSFFNLRFLVEYLYNRFLTSFILNLGGQTSKILDKGSVELLGPYGLETGLLNLSKNITKLDTGVVTSYALYILIALVLYMNIPYIYSKDMSIFILMLYTLFVFINLFVSENQSIKHNDKIEAYISTENKVASIDNFIITESNLLSGYRLFLTKKSNSYCNYGMVRCFHISSKLYANNNDKNDKNNNNLDINNNLNDVNDKFNSTDDRKIDYVSINVDGNNHILTDQQIIDTVNSWFQDYTYYENITIENSHLDNNNDQINSDHRNEDSINKIMDEIKKSHSTSEDSIEKRYITREDIINYVMDEKKKDDFTSEDIDLPGSINEIYIGRTNITDTFTNNSQPPLYTHKIFEQDKEVYALNSEMYETCIKIEKIFDEIINKDSKIYYNEIKFFVNKLHQKSKMSVDNIENKYIKDLTKQFKLEERKTPELDAISDIEKYKEWISCNYENLNLQVENKNYSAESDSISFEEVVIESEKHEPARLMEKLINLKSELFRIYNVDTDNKESSESDNNDNNSNNDNYHNDNDYDNKGNVNNGNHNVNNGNGNNYIIENKNINTSSNKVLGNTESEYNEKHGVVEKPVDTEIATNDGLCTELELFFSEVQNIINFMNNINI